MNFVEIVLPSLLQIEKNPKLQKVSPCSSKLVANYHTIAREEIPYSDERWFNKMAEPAV